VLHIAICDDDIATCSSIEGLLTDISLTFSEKIETEVFFSGEELCSELSKNNYFDIIFLDIELKLMNGVEVGKKIREDMNNETTQIVYISGKTNYAMELFQVRPMDFLIKPITYEKVMDTLTTALKLIQRGNEVFEYSKGYTSYKVLLKDIMYFESNGKKIRIITKHETDEFYGKLSDIAGQLNKLDFFQIHKSYLVNYNYISEFQYNQVKIANYIVLPISQKRRKAVREIQLLRKRGTRKHGIK